MAKRKISLGLLLFGIVIVVAIGQESPTASPQPEETPSATPEQTLSATPEPTESVTPEESAPVSPRPSPLRKVRLRFVPPPMEGTISLGIFDEAGKLVRVLHREAKIDNFTVGSDSLDTTWDGKNDAGEDLPPGKYRARGYLVGQIKVEDLGNAFVPADGSDRVSVRLVANPLVSDTRSVVDLGTGSDSQGSFIKTMDGLPLLTVGKTPNPLRVSITKAAEKSIEIWQQSGGGVIERFHVSNIDQIMAFDCGFVELK